MLAADLLSRLRERGDHVTALDRARLDITDPEAVAAVLPQASPGIVFNCAAYNQVDAAEDDTESAEAVNGYGPGNLAAICRRLGVPLVHFSSDYVFDGRKASPYRIDDPTNPISAYGRSKLLGETRVLESGCDAYVLRTSWLFGLGGSNFVDAILRNARERGELSVVDDERGCPTWTDSLARAAIDLVEKGRFGIYHVTNSEPTTWYDFAAEILRLSDIDIPLHRTSAAELGRPAPRPSNSLLDPRPLPEVLGRDMPSWRQALAEYLRLRAARSSS